MPRSATTFMIFDGIAEDATDFYVALFNGCKIHHVERWAAGGLGVSWQFDLT